MPILFYRYNVEFRISINEYTTQFRNECMSKKAGWLDRSQIKQRSSSTETSHDSPATGSHYTKWTSIRLHTAVTWWGLKKKNFVSLLRIFASICVYGYGAFHIKSTRLKPPLFFFIQVCYRKSHKKWLIQFFRFFLKISLAVMFEIYTINTLIEKKNSRLILLCPKLYLE